MDANFLEFWGNFLLAAAKSQGQLETMANRVRQGMGGAVSGLDDLKPLFATFCGTEAAAKKGAPDFLEGWEKIGEKVLASYEEFAQIMGLVPREKYEELQKKYLDLQEKLRKQVEIIHKLREQLHLAEDRPPPEETVEELLRKQGDQFQQFAIDCMSFLGVSGEKKGKEE